jgi:hypothetical protein
VPRRQRRLLMHPRRLVLDILRPHRRAVPSRCDRARHSTEGPSRQQLLWTFPALIFCHLPTSFTLVFRDMLSCDTMIPGKNIHTLFTIDASIADHFGPGAIARRHLAIQARRRRCWDGICTWADGWDGLWVALQRPRRSLVMVYCLYPGCIWIGSLYESPYI